MANHIYEVELHDGRKYDVTTGHHHDDHHPEDFKKHLIDVIKGAAGGVISTIIIHTFSYKGRR